MFGAQFSAAAVPGRPVLTAARIYYVSPTGSNSNNGLSALAPFLTIQHGIDVAATLDLNGFGVTIQVATGTYAPFNFRPTVGGNVTVQGDSVTPANVVISGSGDLVLVSGPIMGFVAGLKFVSSGGSALRAQFLATLGLVGPCDFGACAASHLYATDGGIISVQSNYNISGGAAVHYYPPNGGEIATPGNTVTFLTNPTNFGAGFAYLTLMARLAAYSQTFVNPAFVTGKRYYAELNSVIFTNGAPITYFPGTIAGTVATGGQYA